MSENFWKMLLPTFLSIDSCSLLQRPDLPKRIILKQLVTWNGDDVGVVRNFLPPSCKLKFKIVAVRLQWSIVFSGRQAGRSVLVNGLYRRRGKQLRILESNARWYHHIIQIHNRVLWDSQYSMEYSSYTLSYWVWEIFFGILSVPHTVSRVCIWMMWWWWW